MDISEAKAGVPEVGLVVDSPAKDEKAAAAMPGPTQGGPRSRTRMLWAGAAALSAAVVASVIAVPVILIQDKGSPPSGAAVPPQPSQAPAPPIPPTAPGTPEPSSTPGAPRWGSNTAHAEACAAEQGDDRYWCNSDCMSNCFDAYNQNGLLLESDDYKLAYCSSVHVKEPEYNGRSCCCAEYIPYHSAADAGEAVPCLGGAKPRQACDTWCLLHSERLHPSASTNCDPGFSFCLPLGEAFEDCDVPIECSDNLRCCCEIFT